MMKQLALGGLAGAAGTTGLNAVTYLDMALRGRAASEAPNHLVEKITEATDHPVPGKEETKENRLTGLGSLSGIAVGVTVGAAAGILRGVGVRPRALVGGTAVALAAMAATDLPLAASGVSDLREWTVSSWLSDLVPHMAYGLITYTALTLLDQ